TNETVAIWCPCAALVVISLFTKNATTVARTAWRFPLLVAKNQISFEAIRGGLRSNNERVKCNGHLTKATFARPPLGRVQDILAHGQRGQSHHRRICKKRF